MPCEDAPCCGCCTVSSMRDQREAEDAYYEHQMLHGEDYDYDDEEWDDDGLLPGEDMDGDFDSGMASAGFGTDEDYGYYGGDEW
jgi:hypothetical protein